ncbi:MAG TPA: universal stress protein [Allosphingosinicella sp.]|nr:universal stress protein [Allosphingosinicella sp.]
MRILTANDLTAGSANALRRSAAFAGGAGSELRVIHAVPAIAGEDVALAARDRLTAALRDVTGREICGESGLSIRICHGDPADVILSQAERYHSDLIVLGAHGEPRLRDALFGTTAGPVIRKARQPVLIARNDPGRAYARVMVAVDDEAAGRVLDVALNFASPDEIHVVHAFGSVLQAVRGTTAVLEDVRNDQDALAAAVRKTLAKSGRPAARIETIVEQGDPMDVIMRAWTKVQPDLVVMGTHGRTGVAHLLHGSIAESALLGCPSDMLIICTSGEEGEDQ